jgi:hypothetical protein
MEEEEEAEEEHEGGVAWGSVVVKALRCQSEGLGIDSH